MRRGRRDRRRLRGRLGARRGRCRRGVDRCGRRRVRRRRRRLRRRSCRRRLRGDDRRRGRGGGCGCRGGSGYGRRLHRCRRARWEQAERVDVALGLRRDANTEVDGGHGVLCVTARAHGPDRRPLGDRVALGDAERAEMNQRHRVPVGRQDRNAAPVGRERAGEAHRAGRRCANRGPVGPGNVDPSVLARRIGVAAERERTEHVAVGRPRPRRGGARQAERNEARRAEQEKTMHEAPPLFSARATRVEEG